MRLLKKKNENETEKKEEKKQSHMRMSQITFTSDVSLWQFLQARDTEEKVRSAWSNFPPWKFRKNVVKGSC